MRRPVVVPLVVILCVLVSGPGPKTVQVKGYTRKDGTYVQPHTRSTPGNSAFAVAPQRTAAPLSTAPARTEPRTSASVAPRITPRVDARLLSPSSTDSVAPTRSPDDEEELRAFKKAKLEYDSLRRLDFGKNLKTEAGLTKWYEELIHDFPGTEAANEAQRRLAGQAPKLLPVPPVPIAPKGTR